MSRPSEVEAFVHGLAAIAALDHQQRRDLREILLALLDLDPYLQDLMQRVDHV